MVGSMATPTGCDTASQNPPYQVMRSRTLDTAHLVCISARNGRDTVRIVVDSMGAFTLKGKNGRESRPRISIEATGMESRRPR
jgi:hypothetical protein